MKVSARGRLVVGAIGLATFALYPFLFNPLTTLLFLGMFGALLVVHR